MYFRICEDDGQHITIHRGLWQQFYSDFWWHFTPCLSSNRLYFINVWWQLLVFPWTNRTSWYSHQPLSLWDNQIPMAGSDLEGTGSKMSRPPPPPQICEVTLFFLFFFLQIYLVFLKLLLIMLWCPFYLGTTPRSEKLDPPQRGHINMSGCWQSSICLRRLTCIPH